MTQPTSAVMEEDEEDIAMPAEESERYFLSSSAGSTSSLISKHLEAIHKHLNETFLIDPMVSAQLQKSLLRVVKAANASVVPEVKEACQHLAVKLEMQAFIYKVYEERRSSSLKSLNWLVVSKGQLRDQFYTMDHN